MEGVLIPLRLATLGRRLQAAVLVAVMLSVLLLSAAGIYALMSITVSQRRKEIGIHMALGASRQTVLRMVLGQGARLTAVGLVAGLAASVLLTRFLQTQLFNVKPTDPSTITAVVGFIALVAAAACYIPASRATRVDPMVVLRDE